MNHTRKTQKLKKKKFDHVMSAKRPLPLCQHLLSQDLSVQWPCVRLQQLWQKVKNQEQYEQTQETCVWIPHCESLATERTLATSLSQARSTGRKRGRGCFWPSPGRGSTCFATLIGNLLFHNLNIFFCFMSIDMFLLYFGVCMLFCC